MSRRFEELEIWQEGRKIVKDIYEISGEGAWNKDFALREQIRRASISIPSNIAEGFGRGGNREFIQFLYIAKGSLYEVQSLLYNALDMGYIKENKFKKIYENCEVLARKITKMLAYLQNFPTSGPKHHSPGTTNQEPKTKNSEPGTSNSEPSTTNQELGTKNSEPNSRRLGK